MPTQTLAEFILYIAPGFIALFIFYKYYPTKEPSTFTQISQSTLFVIFLIVLLRMVDDLFLNHVLNSSYTGFPSNTFSMSIIGTGILAGYILVLQLRFRSWLSQKKHWLRWLASRPDSIWQQVNNPNIKNWAVIFLDDSIYLGWISNYRFDPNETDQDFLLRDARRVDDKLKTIYQVTGIGVYLNTRNVTRIEFVEGVNK